MQIIHSCMVSISEALVCVCIAGSTFGQSAPTPKRPIEAADVIAMTMLSSDDTGKAPDSQVAQFSPDGKHFVLVLRKGNLSENINEYSICLFTSASPTTPDMKKIATMRSSSGRPGVRGLRWMPDNRTITFLGENGNEESQVYSVDIATGQLKRITNQATSVVSYELRQADRQLIYLASTPGSGDAFVPKDERKAFVVDKQYLYDLLGGRTDAGRSKLTLYTKKPNSKANAIWTGPQHAFRGFLSVSPNGRFAIVSEELTSGELPLEWKRYNYGRVAAFLDQWLNTNDSDDITPFPRYVVVDLCTGDARRLWEAPPPVPEALTMKWSKDGNSVTLKDVFLPLTTVGPVDTGSRLTQHFDVTVDLASMDWRVNAGVEWDDRPKSNPLLKIQVVESIDVPGKIYAENTDTKQKTLLLDLNPQFQALEFGKAGVISWSVHGITVDGGLYLPPNYVKGNRYPLVIQTHGFDKDQFSMDGRSEWSSAFAARMLAARGIVVLQAYDFVDRADHDRIDHDRTLGSTTEESFRTFAKLAYEGAIEELDRRAIADPKRVGISGFSRTVWFVDYTLTHSSVPFLAASITDGIDGGYFNYIAFQEREAERDNGGMAPFGEEGRRLWFTQSPGFNLDKVTAPVRLLCLNTDTSILEAWEWFAGLKLLGKPVDMVAIPHSTHILQAPKDRQIAMEGMTDWFDFWLQGNERPNGNDPDEYKRWAHLRELQSANARVVRPTPVGATPSN